MVITEYQQTATVECAQCAGIGEVTVAVGAPDPWSGIRDERASRCPLCAGTGTAPECDACPAPAVVVFGSLDGDVRVCDTHWPAPAAPVAWVAPADIDEWEVPF